MTTEGITQTLRIANLKADDVAPILRALAANMVRRAHPSTEWDVAAIMDQAADECESECEKLPQWEQDEIDIAAAAERQAEEAAIMRGWK